MPALRRALVSSWWPPILSHFAIEVLPERSCLRSLRGWVRKALIAALLLVAWVAPSNAAGIYWTSAPPNRMNSNQPTVIGTANLDGTGVNQSFISLADRPDDVAVGGSYIYWADQLSN